ncbi:MAG: hypothetical protein ACRD68_09505, partial [Pyrinomonadaceae bacterium]
MNIPRIPKVEKPKREPPPKTDDSRPTPGLNTNTPGQPESPSQPESRAAGGGAKRAYVNQRPTDTPVFVPDSLYIQATTHKEYWKFPNQKKYSSWAPQVRFNMFYNNDKSLNYT